MSKLNELEELVKQLENENYELKQYRKVLLAVLEDEIHDRNSQNKLPFH